MFQTKRNISAGFLFLAVLFLLSACMDVEPKKIEKPSVAEQGEIRTNSPTPTPSPIASVLPSPTPSPAPSSSPQPSPSPTLIPSPSPSPSSSPRPSTSPAPSPSSSPVPSPSVVPSPTPTPPVNVGKAPLISGAFFPNDPNPWFEWFSLTGATQFRYKFDDSNLTSGATETSANYLRSPINLSPGTHTFYVQEKGSNGSWSSSASMTGTITSGPMAPGRPGVSLQYDPEVRRLYLTMTKSSATKGNGYFEVLVDDPSFVSTAGMYPPDYVISTQGLLVGRHYFFVREMYVDTTISINPIGGAVTVVPFDHVFTPPPDFEARAIAQVNNPRPRIYITPNVLDDPLLNQQHRYRAKANDSDLTTGALDLGLIATRMQTPMNLPTGNHLLYIQGRESQTLAWSGSVPVAMNISLTVGQPHPPIVTLKPNSVEPWKPTFTWTSGGGGGAGTYRFKVTTLGNNISSMTALIDSIENAVNTVSLDRGATETTTASRTLNLTIGNYYLFLVQERNASGVWSASGYEFIMVPLYIPTGPVPSPTPGPQGAYWFQGDYNQSCTEVCTPHGGYHEATRTYIGSDGTSANCKGLVGSFEGGSRYPHLIRNGSGVGCFTTESSMRDLVPTTAGAKDPMLRRICGCKSW